LVILSDENLPRLVFVNKMDRDNASFSRVMEELGTKFEAVFVPVQLPIGAQESFQVVVDLVSMKALLGPEGKEADIPADMQDQAAEARTQMMEYAAEVDDELMMKYLEGEELTNEEIRAALAQGTKSGAIVRCFVGSAANNIGVRALLDAIVGLLPAPAKSNTRAPSRPVARRLSSRPTPPVAGGAGVQDHRRPHCRQAHLLPRVQRHLLFRLPA
jgi:elongation factor G